ncbi:hypothetical protein PHABIO_360 [Pseudomonas phage Phabio]|uniref:Uncharacterized protein n=1 Tax=Pseudomonas phage Phabio TaxID=2006668 RepID=A0A1Y0SU08_9CAUD|nr:hypothetical protein MZD05_gp360 [Pseudomonas phage Phabio]ARV76991.1 hypothetical protein PHABIO_360 [Pseudomonas phage Phabio]
MSKHPEIHFEMLHLQVASIFKYYGGMVSDKWVMATYKPLTIDGVNVIEYSLEQDEATPAKRKLVITIMVEERQFTFYQNYNYGVPLDNGITYLPKQVNKDLIDLEYALSIVTEHTADQIVKA